LGAADFVFSEAETRPGLAEELATRIELATQDFLRQGMTGAGAARLDLQQSP
jgi:hypothetical protein